jgi:hypothetical protein
VRAALAVVASIIGSAACHYHVGSDDSAFYRWDGRRMHCAIDIDSVANNDIPSIDTGLDRARDRGEVLELYTHVPGTTVPVDKIRQVFEDAAARGLSFVTYDDMAADRVPHVGSLAFGFDDSAVSAWLTVRPILQQYNAHVTFFITRYARMSDTDRAGIAQLAADGHAIEAHTVSHLRGPKYVEDFGMDAYLADEVQPSIDLLVADGYPVTTFAYPFGARTPETDKAIFDRVQLIRSVSFTYGAPVESPCPF